MSRGDPSPRTPATQPVGRPTGGVSAKTRRKIIEAAIQAFSEHGYDGASIREISASAGVTHGTTYFYFPSKPELYRAAYEEALEATFRYFAQSVGDEATLAESFSAILDAAQGRLAHAPRYSMLALRYRTDFRVSPEVGRVRTDETERFIDTLITRAIDRGEVLAEDRDPAVEALSALLWGLTVIGVRSEQATQNAVTGLKRLLLGTFSGTPD